MPQSFNHAIYSPLDRFYIEMFYLCRRPKKTISKAKDQKA